MTQHQFISVTSSESSQIKLLQTGALSSSLAVQPPPHGSSPGPSSTAPKSHIIISGNAASIVGQTGNIMATTSNNSQLLQPGQLPNSGQTLTFAIRTATHGGHQVQQPGSVQLNTVSLKSAQQPASNNGQQQPQSSGQQQSALIAALSQPSALMDQSTTTPLMRTFTPGTKGMPVVLMQTPPASNSNLMAQVVTSNAAPLTNLPHSSAISSSIASRPSAKMTSLPQTSSVTMLSSVAGKHPSGVVGQSECTSTSTVSSARNQDTALIEALMSPIKTSFVPNEQHKPM